MKANKHEINGYIYVTSEEEIKEGDYFLDDNNSISQSYKLSQVQYANPKKIILTNNPNLPIQQLTSKDVEYCKGKSEVKVEKCPIEGVYSIDIREIETVGLKFENSIENTINIMSMANSMFSEKEQPKETIEEVAEKYAVSKSSSSIFYEAHKRDFLNDHAKQTLYTESDIKQIAFSFYYDMSKKMKIPENLISENETNFTEWFNKHKKQQNGNIKRRGMD